MNQEIVALQTKHSQAKAAVSDVNKLFTPNKKAIENRDIAFKPLS